MSQIDHIVTNAVQPSPAVDCSVAAPMFRERMSAELLDQIAGGLGRSDVAQLLPEGNDRRWALVLESDAYEAWVIAWPAGTGLEMHDHDGSAASVHVVRGRLRERYVADDGVVTVRWLTEGETTALPHDHEHEVVNLEAEEVVSVHVYSPRLTDQSFRATRSIG